MEVPVSILEVFDFPAENVLLHRADSIEKENIARVRPVGQIPDDAHHRRDADAAANQDDAVRLRAGEGERTRGG